MSSYLLLLGSSCPAGLPVLLFFLALLAQDHLYRLSRNTPLICLRYSCSIECPGQLSCSGFLRWLLSPASIHLALATKTQRCVV